ncbi:uncharacterized protein PG986_011238 [Apiospora aurea]|uniref:Uncharacterized protein n=1 Tax=Apiospora aurea TaxID=335848 RepID=A0ABR1Q4K0_9PEZI
MSDTDEILHKTGSVKSDESEPNQTPPPRAPSLPPPRQPSHRSVVVEDDPDDTPVRAGPSGSGGLITPNRTDDLMEGKQPKASERRSSGRRNLIITAEPSGNSIRVPWRSSTKSSHRGREPSDEIVQYSRDENALETSHAYRNPRKNRPEGRARPSREGAVGQPEQEETDWGVSATRNRAVQQSNFTYTRPSEQVDSYPSRFLNNTESDGPLGELMAYQSNPFQTGNDYATKAYFGAGPSHGPYTYPSHGQNYVQPINYAPPPVHYPTSQYHPNYGYPPQPIPPYTLPPPSWPQADTRTVPQTTAQDNTRQGKDVMSPELKKALEEIENHKREEEIIQTFRIHDRKNEILDDAKTREERLRKMEKEDEQKRAEERRQEVARIEYQNKLDRATKEAKEQLEQRQRDEEKRREADEKKFKDLEADLRRRIEAELEEKEAGKERRRNWETDLRRRIEAEMAEKEAHRQREIEKQMYLERQIREKVMRERKEQEEMAVREQLRKQEIEKRLEHEFEMKRQKANEIELYRKGVEAQARMQAAQIIESEKRKLDLERLKLEIQQDTDQVIRDTIYTSSGDATFRPHGASINVEDYQDQRTVSEAMQREYAGSQIGSLRASNIGDQESHISQGPPSEPMSPTLGRFLSRSDWNSLNGNLGTSRTNSQQTILGRPESVRHHLYNHSRNPFAAQQRNHLGSQQQLHQPIPVYDTNPYGISQSMALPNQSPSGLSSNIHIPRPYVEAEQVSPGQAERYLRPQLQSGIASSLQAHIESEMGSQAGASEILPNIERSWSPPSRPPNPGPIQVGTPSKPNKTDSFGARENALPRNHAPGNLISLSSNSPASTPRESLAAFPAPSPPRATGIGGSLPTRSLHNSYDGDSDHVARVYASPVAKTEPSRQDTRSSRELTSLVGSKPDSWASENQHVPSLKHKKRFSK